MNRSMTDLYRTPNPRYSPLYIVPCLFAKICTPREMPLWPSRHKLWLARHKLWPSRHMLWPARHKLSPARRKLWPARHKLWPDVRQRLSDNIGGPAPRCDGHIRLITKHTSSRLAALCASRARSAGTACWLMSHHAVTGAFKPVSYRVCVDATSRRYWGLQACLTPREC